MAKKSTTYLVYIREMILEATRAGLIEWEPTSQPRVPFETRNGGTTLRGFKTIVNGLGVETIVTQKNPNDPMPGKWSQTDNFAFGLRISVVGGREVTYTTDQKVIPGDTSAELIHGMDQRFSFAEFCEDIQHLVGERNLVETLHGRLLRLFHPA